MLNHSSGGIPAVEPVARLIEELHKLPGIGPKSAQAAAVPAPTGTSRGCAACRLWLRRFFADSDGTPRSGFHRDCVVVLLRAAATAVGVDTPRRHSPDSLARLAESLSFDNLTSLVNSVSTSDLTDVPTADDGGGDGWAVRCRVVASCEAAGRPTPSRTIFFRGPNRRH